MATIDAGSQADVRREAARRAELAALMEAGVKVRGKSVNTPYDEHRAAARLVITSRGISVDNADLVAEWTATEKPEDPEAKLKGWAPPAGPDLGPPEQLLREMKNIAHIRDGKIDLTEIRDGQDGLLIEPLYQALKETTALTKKISTITNSEFGGWLKIHADQNTPFGVIRQVLYTAGQAEYALPVFVTKRNGETHGMLVEQHKLCCGQFSGFRPRDENRESCLHAALFIVQGGLNLRVTRYDGGHPDRETSDVLVLGPDRSCPSVRLCNGRVDLVALDALIASLGQQVPLCAGCNVGGRRDTAWSRVARVFEHVRERGEFKYTTLGATETEDMSCDGGLPVEELSVESKP